MGRQTKEVSRKNDENKLATHNEIGNLMLDKMIKVVDTGSVNVKLKQELIDLENLFKQRQDRLLSALRERYRYDTSVKHSQDFLFKHVNSKMSLVIMYADLVGSTQMSMTLPLDKLVTIIRAFSHEISSVVEIYRGHVLKYVGDAVIAFFGLGVNRYLSCDRAVSCAKWMINVVKYGINPILGRYGYPELGVKIGMDVGEIVVVQYAYDKSSQIDLLGYTMNVSAKITSLTGANKISVGEKVFELLHPEVKADFHRLVPRNGEWKYINRDNGKVYKVYTLK
jgi:class 3 adenylate cyclase